MKTRLLLSIIVWWINSAVAADMKPEQVIKRLHLPAGFKISLFAIGLPNARTLALGDDGVIYVGTRQQGSVYAVKDEDGDGVADKRYIIAKDLYMPNGVAYRNGDLYVAEVHRILKFEDIRHRLGKKIVAKVVYDQFPSDRHHGWKYLRFGPDGKLYTAIGAPCNICLPKKAIYTSLVRLNRDGSGLELLASGIRNSVGFDWQPGSEALFFTDNGRDYLGDDEPADELNHWRKEGDHFGYPFCHGGDVLDPEYGKDKSCLDYQPPAWRFKAHMAPLGMRFYTGSQFPKRFENQLFVAQHGSWNRSRPHGYRMVLLKFKQDQVISEQVFIDGWLTDQGEVLGRPTDILQMPDGSLLIADDTLGVIYRVSYQK